MSISRLTSIVLLALCWALWGTPAAAGGPSPPDSVTCVACVVEDDTGRMLWGRAEHDPLPNASTTKIVTALVTVEEVDLDEEVVVSTGAAATGGGGLDLMPGDRYSVAALLHALLMTSSNDAATALAEHVAGSQEAFVAEMNETLDRLGGEDSTFVTPHGLDTPGHEASAADLAMAGAALLENPVLEHIVGRREAEITGSGGTQLLENTNLLLDRYPGAIGIKTGSTALAGEVLVGAAERGGETVVAVAMQSTASFDDVAELLDFGFARVKARAQAADLPWGPGVDHATGALETAFDSALQRVLAGEESLAF